ncbi:MULTISPECIES: isoprenoid biosynthesis glyoxalase ElbB [Lentimicrobium]|jgi:enhancing lycopene biosynthesis protein 2|uniref:Enhancing lycopene biosynthesis protein 2 n=1 Tax=Lentimicrobium saccharophilum TaxID=1678841 RepID=A0A0S7BXI2_9BACT|nr:MULTISPECIES: isoprenoid biosynthesis glyoxalase ElbB [Lentimicrobium]MCO5258040.1 isoprenoid biosynthesis glyoxalase ElbB [Lentimicrobium sp.]MCO5261827.1 isoprenoid biosynthesis glyoxalase ElbB [Lentimicrobium sp.]GAP41956.1 enhancing lycopene biosynthesis protein 2 [Lentimicrobium saccharophilum]HOP12992.1 isoprenoid biosynthesis glyoxalase ElbB [Lentimicrobium sp.]HPF65576.1 isoprenoid biosynthesis glyoxalase ElbB [Lentimicrobium sp.]
MKKFAVVLAGNGVFDGAEIHEATLSLLAIKKHGADYEIFAPDIPQHHVINHLTGKEMNETRNVLVEAARIARGKIRDLKQLNVREFDALLFPGGFGVAKNLCTWAFDGPACKVNPDVEKVIREMTSMKKPIGALCISPVLLAKVLGNVEITIGNDPATAAGVEKAGATHVNTGHGEVVRDPHRPVFTTPCYMLDASIVDIANGAENIVKAILAELK